MPAVRSRALGLWAAAAQVPAYNSPVPTYATGIVTKVLAARPGVLRLVVEVDGKERRATCYPAMTGIPEEGDRVVVNTTAVELGLGTGGEDFVLWNLDRRSAGSLGEGHIVKLRYTPWQLETLVAEAPESEHHPALAAAESIDGMPVVACGVHSQVPAAAALAKRRRPGLRIAYVMSDAGALPIAHSDLVARMRDCGVVDLTVTCGHAFGGDLEAVNIFSGLAAARLAGGADLAIVAPGPGIVGTQSVLGHSGMDQGQALAAGAALGGRAVAALRISFADPRPRHRGVSQHSLSALRLAVHARVEVAVPSLDEERLATILARLEETGIVDRHDLRLMDAGDTAMALETFGLAPTTMGRSVAEDPAFFQSAGAAAALAAADDGQAEAPGEGP